MYKLLLNLTLKLRVLLSIVALVFSFQAQAFNDTNCGNIAGFQFSNGTETVAINNYQAYYFGDLPTNFYVDLLVAGYSESATFQVENKTTGQTYNIGENHLPYTFPGGNGAWNFGYGEFEIKAKIFKYKNCQGSYCDSESIKFEILSSPPCGEVTGFVFTDGVTSMPIVDGTSYDVNTLPTNFYVGVMLSGSPESVRFEVKNEDTGAEFTKIDNNEEFSYPTDGTPWSLGASAEFKVKAEIFDMDNTMGNKCDYDYLKFTLFDSTFQAPICGDVTGFVLTDGVTSIPIVDGNSYDINALPANFYVGVMLSGSPESVRFEVKNEDTGDEFTSIDNDEAFTYPSDGSAWSLGISEFKVKAEIYDMDNAMGDKCDYDYLKFTLYDGSIPDCPCKGGLTSLTFSYSGNDILTTNSGMITDNGDGTFTITNVGDKLGSNVEIYNNNGTASIHTSCSQDLLGINFGAGIVVIGYIDNYGNIANINDGCTQAPSCGDVIGFVFTDGVINIPIVDGDSYDINALPANYYVGVMLSGSPESVRFEVKNEDTGDEFTSIDNDEAFTYPSDGSAWSLGISEFKVKAEIYDMDNAMGDKCDYDYLKFTLYDGSIPDCPCEGGLVELTFAYSGTGTVTTNSGALIDNGDGTYTAVAIGDKLEKNFEVYIDGAIAQIHTSCSQDLLGITFDGLVQVVGYADTNNNYASIDGGCYQIYDCDIVSAGTGSINSNVVMVEADVDFFVTVTPNGDAILPQGYVLGTILTTATNLTIEGYSNTTTIQMPEVTSYFDIHMFAYDPTTFNLNDIVIGTTTAFDLLDLIDNSQICADLDVIGVNILVIGPGTSDRSATTNTGASKNEIDKTEDLTIDSDLKLYPNPVVNELNVNITLLENEMFNYSVLDLNGKQVLTGTLSNNTNLIRTKALAAGLYILKLESEGRTFTKKILVNK